MAIRFQDQVSGTSFDNGAIFKFHWIDDFTSLILFDTRLFLFITHCNVAQCVNTFAEDAITGQKLACSSRSRSGFLQVARLTVFCCSTLCALPNCVLRYLGEKRISRRCYVVRRTVIARCSDRSKTLSTNAPGGKKRCVK